MTTRMSNTEVSIRPFHNFGDIDFAFDMTSREKWHIESKIELHLFYEYDRQGCFIAEVDGEKAGICIATAYTKNGFIGELIVSPKFRKNGIGTALMQKAIHFLQFKNVQNIYLDGVVNAIPLYKKLGFHEIYRSLRLFGDIEPSISPSVSDISEQDLPEILNIDRNCFNEDRGFFLIKRFTNYPHLCFKLSINQSIQAYLFGREGNGGWISAGPIVSLAGPNDAIQLLKSFQERIGYQPFSMGILEKQKELIYLLIQCGLKPNPDPPIRMVLGSECNIFEDERCLVIGSPAKG
jgi:ribosomal protein S18 acetylase RimI-like enzyme